MMGKMMDANMIDYYIINCAIPSIITIENCYQIDFGKPVVDHIDVFEFFLIFWVRILSYLALLQEGATVRFPSTRQ